MHLEKVNIHEHSYTLAIAYQNDEKLRKELNRLTQQVWEFTFENFYQSGFWDDNCIVYSLFEGERIVSHVTASLFDTEIKSDKKKLLQFGTVMTDPEYQNKGLSRFLMERVLADFKQKTDGMLLFANDSVLDFYPKFGFRAVAEYQAFKNITNKDFSTSVGIRKLNLDNREDLDLFTGLVESNLVNTTLPVQSRGISMFYCYAYPDFGHKDTIYYIEELEAIVVANVKEKVLEITEVFSKNMVDLQQIIAAFIREEFTSVRLGFTPLEEGFEYELLTEEDTVLYVSEELYRMFEEQKLVVPFLSHT
ncbi:GNAT family N-acetyltransferase [Elizabethkingia ursingii]|uniref:GCN5 family acetyltransferase n=1 Tax=Elizabethkingia ursingii TaxID=1756150 RepID=A0AAJ3NEV1_9FLAO|nr:GNAT family N-acetyltransferase [Elizabethkingia ursingii]AQX07738.1 GCN5 family acetyltransferase [Elizabethkingia ursingii]OPB79414.1 GCN5 family acetyltransferase [Elizabethkingia ursingii]